MKPLSGPSLANGPGMTLVRISQLNAMRLEIARLKRRLTKKKCTEFTYASAQHTICAVCGQDKHTPLRRDHMGGYVCLTCIDHELDRLYASEIGLNAWYKAFGTTQLTHALARLEAAEKKAERYAKWP